MFLSREADGASGKDAIAGYAKKPGFSEKGAGFTVGAGFTNKSAKPRDILLNPPLHQQEIFR
ncbi:MAG TPA: hypothetical protein DD990_13430 [Cyanobacteria bacterium UBA11368]|nr:hypothetical protein [Cyanobacteria bacterium UBA11368]